MMEESTMETVQTEDESQVSRSTRVRQPSKRYFSDEYVNLTDDGEPQSFQEVIEIDDNEKWMQVMKEEMHSLVENQTYEIIIIIIIIIKGNIPEGE